MNPTMVSRSGMRHLIDGNVKPKQGRIKMLCGFTIRPDEERLELDGDSHDCPWCFPQAKGTAGDRAEKDGEPG